ncbi:MAG: hypothetical protein N2043_01845 [Ignavibacterium sp.]|nr:hypothetical protein [Ignavibacterium sp.]
MFRCPNPDCRQGYKLDLGDYAIFNDPSMKKPVISINKANEDFYQTLIKSQFVFAENGEEINPYLSSVYKFILKSVFSGEKEITCHLCNKTHLSKDWLDCYQNPLSYEYDTDELCFCGEELYLERKPNGRYGMYCDKCKTFSNKYRTYSGSADTKKI